MKLCEFCKQRIPVAIKDGRRICDECVIAQLAAAEKRASEAETQGAYVLYIARAWLKGLGDRSIATRENIESLEAGIFKQLPAAAQAVAEVLDGVRALRDAPHQEHFCTRFNTAENEAWDRTMEALAKLDAARGKEK